MTNDTPQTINHQPPMWLFNNIINPLITLILRSPLHRLVSHFVLLLTFTGRKSGKQFTTPVAYDRKAGELHLLTDSPWWVNLRENAPVEVLLQGKRERGTAHAVTDVNEVAQALLEDIQKRDVTYAKRRFGLQLDPNKTLTTDDMLPVARRRKLICIRLFSR